MDIKTKLKEFKEFSEIGFSISEICLGLDMNIDELTKLAQSSGYEDCESFRQHYQNELINELFKSLSTHAQKGNRQAKNFRVGKIKNQKISITFETKYFYINIFCVAPAVNPNILPSTIFELTATDVVVII